MSIIKLLLRISPWGGGDKTPVFDVLARGFVAVTWGTHLKEHRSGVLSAFEEELKPRISRMGADKKRNELSSSHPWQSV
jgi:hypothetical protein